MYVPRAYEEIRVPVLHDLIEAQPFGSLVTMGASGLFASHIPMVLERTAATLGTLHCHVARPNAQWREFSTNVEALVIFAGDQHYISPSWYPEKQETGKVVPTWNYAVVHAYGTLRAIHDTGWLMAHLERLTDIHEAGFEMPWKVSDAPADYVSSLSKGIVGLELTITRLEGKWKVSQNRPERDRDGVEQGLEKLNTPESLAMKGLVKGVKS